MEKTRLFVDMDGTLARFHDEVYYLERMYEKGFFADLKPFEQAVIGVREFIKENPNVEVFILSGAVDGEPPYCRTEKHQWLDLYLPEIDHNHRIFTTIGKHKSLFVPNEITKRDFLFDDYNLSLEQWEQDGGTGIKCHNNINHKGLVGEKWRGAVVRNESHDIAARLASAIKGEKTLITSMFSDKNTSAFISKLGEPNVRDAKNFLERRIMPFAQDSEIFRYVPKDMRTAVVIPISNTATYAPELLLKRKIAQCLVVTSRAGYDYHAQIIGETADNPQSLTVRIEKAKQMAKDNQSEPFRKLEHNKTR